MTRVVVVGGGIAGLSAAWNLIERGVPAESIVVLEGSPALGGKLAIREVGGIRIDVGAEAMLATRPEAVALTRAVGLGDDLVHPATTSSRLFVHGRLMQLPGGLMMGAPTDLHALATAGILGPRALARIPLDFLKPRTKIDGDVSVGAYVGARLGRGVVDYLVDPLLGGVYSGRADDLSLQATVPQLYAKAQQRRSLLVAAREAMARPAPKPGQPPRPVFAGITGGVARLIEALAVTLRQQGTQIRCNAMVRTISHDSMGWRLVTGPTTDPLIEEATALILATPATATSRLLADLVPPTARELAAIEYANVAVVNLAYRADDVGELPGSGFLAPPVDGGTVKAATFLGQKWQWIGQAGAERDLVLLRASVGRYRDAAALTNTDEAIGDLVHADLARAIRLKARPVETIVTRWGGALPQYAVGHVERVARIRDGIGALPTLALAGAAFDGVGIAACIASAELAATRIADSL